MTEFIYSTLASASDARPVQHRAANFAGFINTLARDLVTEIPFTPEYFAELPKKKRAGVKDGPAFIAAELDGKGRTVEHVKSCSAVVVDLDGGNWSAERIARAVQGLQSAFYETASSSESDHRWRVVVPYRAAITPNEHQVATRNFIRERFPGADASSSDRLRLWYGPACFKPPGKAAVVHAVHKTKGKALLPDLTGFATKKPASHGMEFTGSRWNDTNMDLAAEALSKIDPDCSRAQWREIACAIHDGTHGDAEGLEMLITWSCGGFHGGQAPENFTGEADCRKLWQGITPGKGVTRATLFAKARNARPAKKSNAKKSPPFNGGGISAAPAAAKVNGSHRALGIGASDILKRSPEERLEIWKDRMGPGAWHVVARPKCGKSWFHLNLALAVSEGRPFLGAGTEATGVLLIAAEDTVEDIRRRLVSMKAEPSKNFWVMCAEDVEQAAKNACQYDADGKLEGQTEPHVWLEEVLRERPDIGLVILDTQETFEATWRFEELQHRPGDITAVHYQSARIYQTVAQKLGRVILLTQHTRKRNGQKISDYHETINKTLTAVAGVAGSIVLADHPDAEVGAGDPRRVLSLRARSFREQMYEISLDDQGVFKYAGDFYEVQHTRAQSELMEAVEALQDGESYVSIHDLAEETGTTARNVKAHLRRLRRSESSQLWKGRKLETKPGRGGGVRLAMV